MDELPSLPLSRPPAAPPGAADVRHDGRTIDQLRPLRMQLGVVGQAAGSAYLELSDTKVVCSVFGPHQTEGREYMQRGSLETTLRFTSFARRERSRNPSPASTAEERELSMALGSALEGSVQLDQYPKSTIAVHALVLQDDGGALAAAVTCASLALADAGLQLYDMVAACSCAVRGEVVMLDCCRDELHADVTGRTFIAQMPVLSHTTLLRQSGAASFAHVTEAMQLALSGCGTVHGQMRAALLDKVRAQPPPAAAQPPAESVEPAAG